jgi:DNA-binding transcriptional MerR regulator
MVVAGITIQQAAERTALSVHTLRYYERAGLLLEPPPRAGSGHRRYTERDVDWLVFLTRLRSTGMPIRAMRRYTDLVRRGSQTEPDRLALLREHRAAVAERIAQLSADLEVIDYKIASYQQRSHETEKYA